MAILFGSELKENRYILLLKGLGYGLDENDAMSQGVAAKHITFELDQEARPESLSLVSVM
jgi:hypothetical protein